MKKEDLKQRYPDCCIHNIGLPMVYSRRYVEEMLTTIHGHDILRLMASGTQVELVTSSSYGSFIKQLTPGAKVIMTGGEIHLNPEYREKVWTVSHTPALMCGSMACWLDGFSGAYSCEMLKLAE